MIQRFCQQEITKMWNFSPPSQLYIRKDEESEERTTSNRLAMDPKALIATVSKKYLKFYTVEKGLMCIA